MPNHRWVTGGADKSKTLGDVVLADCFAQSVADAHALKVRQDHRPVLSLEVGNLRVREMKHTGESDGLVVPRRNETLRRPGYVGA